MKKPLLILIFLLAGVSGLAQEENGFRVPDSLMMKLKENEDENAARAGVLCEVLDHSNKQYNIMGTSIN